ncbi:MAG TPA: SpoIID/LytB domain-containing protein [Phycisphaerae bacterium]|nr:SpoIID/LytB domain-containing protein [Phycisphaerae bacterium]HQL73287.1 SpoIID/LytB domain-containing protein [Phycisphaerae bacterium]
MDETPRTDLFPVPVRPIGRLRQLLPVLPLVLLSVGCLIGPLLLPSCRPSDGPEVQEWQPVYLKGVPEVRVLIVRPQDSVTVSTTAGYRLYVGPQVVSESAEPAATVIVRRSGGRWAFNTMMLDGADVVLEPVGGLLKVGPIAYRGRLRFRVGGNEQVAVINHVDLESYLAGVLPRELYASWSQETYRALAVAARTFALYNLRQGGGSRDYDLGADESSQCYGGQSAETDKSWQAVRSTHGLVLAYGQPGRERIFLAQYSSCCGGCVNDAAVIRSCEDIPPLRGGQACDDCRAASRYRWPAVRVSKTDLYDALAVCYPKARELGGVSTIRATSTTSYGRTVWIDVIGTTAGKSIRIRAEDLRLALLRGRVPAGKTLYSMNCQINDVGDHFTFTDGRGHGHGVGICQWGAEGKAQKGWSGEQILGYYYPQAKLLKAY